MSSIVAVRRMLGAAFLLTALALPASAAQIELKSAWMRPAAAGSDARAYVDIVSDTPLRLTGASTPLARKVEIVVVQNTDGTDPGKVVKSLPVTPGTPTRLAYKGNHLRLVGVREDLKNGRSLPVTLQFKDPSGKRYNAQADVLVRGLLLPRGLPGT